jgi:hypothetical protein
MTVDDSTEILHLRATVRDLLALSAIPEALVGKEAPAITAELADVLIESLQLDFAFVRLCDPKQCEAVEVMRGALGRDFRNGCNSASLCSAKFGKEIVTKVSMGPPLWTGLFANIGA